MTGKRIRLAVHLALLAVAVALPSIAAAIDATPGARPNIVLILADDPGEQNDLGADDDATDRALARQLQQALQAAHARLPVARPKNE